MKRIADLEKRVENASKKKKELEKELQLAKKEMREKTQLNLGKHVFKKGIKSVEDFDIMFAEYQRLKSENQNQQSNMQNDDDLLSFSNGFYQNN